MLHTLPQLRSSFKSTCTFPVLCTLRTSGPQRGQDYSHPTAYGSVQNVSIQCAHPSTYTSSPRRCAWLHAQACSSLLPVLCNTFSLSTKTHTYIFSLGFSWLDEMKAMSIEFPFIPAKTLKMIGKQELPISEKKILCIIQYTASGSSPSLFGKRSFSPNGSENFLTIKH